MKNNWLLYMSIIFILLNGCAADSLSETNLSAEQAKEIKSFALVVDETKYYGVIDEESKVIKVGGIDYSSNITDVEWTLADGVVMGEPDPKTFVGKQWDKEAVFSLEAGGRKVDYKIILNDYQGYVKKKYMNVGYLPVSEYHPEKRELKWDALTHIIITPLYITADGELDDRKMTWAMEGGVSAIAARAHSKGVKALISIMSVPGEDNNTSFYTALETPEKRTKLIDNLIKYCQRNDLDGIDVDYEVGAYSGQQSNVRLLPFMKELYEKKGDLLLTGAVWVIDYWKPLYTTEYHKYVDYINLMAYGLGGWNGSEKEEGQHSPYEGAVKAIELWTNDLQAPRSKLLLGVPFYGFSWDGLEGIEEGLNPFISYANIMKARPDMKDEDNFGRTWYNGRNTIRKKCQLAKEEDLAGIMIWDLRYDDDRPEFSLLDVIADELDMAD